MYVAFDVLYRLLQHAGYRVQYVRNFTDVDDKIIARAAAAGMRCDELTERFIAEFTAVRPHCIAWHSSLNQTVPCRASCRGLRTWGARGAPG